MRKDVGFSVKLLSDDVQHVIGALRAALGTSARDVTTRTDLKTESSEV